MYSNKLSPSVQLALRYENLLTPESRAIFQDPVEPTKWRIIAEYIGNLEEEKQSLNLDVFYLNENFALITLLKQDVPALSDERSIIYISFAQELAYIDQSFNQTCMTNVIAPIGRYKVTGKGVLVGIIDTGIDYSHPDFIMPNGKSRIRFLWDQTIVGSPPLGFRKGTEYTNEELNMALAQPEKEEQLAIVPSQDTIGHGTAMAGIAAGNGRGSGGRNRGMAIESELLIVKIGPEGGESTRPNTREVMLGIKYVIEKAKELSQPLVILLGIATNIGGHDGAVLIEQYIAEMSLTWPCNFVVGTGNQGDKGGHASGSIKTGEEKIIQLLIDKPKPSYQMGIWKEFIDEMGIIIESPQGEQTEILSILTPNRAFFFGNTTVLVNISEPRNNITKQVIYIVLEAQTPEGINIGVWNIRLRGFNVLNGSYNAWGSINKDSSDRTRFLIADISTTLTIPSTTESITSVAAFNANSFQLAPFSGRGYTANGRVKPDLSAPGVNVLTASIQRDILYEPFSGTSASAAFVAGAYALLMEYGIIQLGLPYLHGETLKSYMLATAQRPESYGPYPNKEWGYGRLCVEAALNRINEINTSSF
ncbi:peptidase S8 [Sporanaerobium hydrogeniformans]|uniref:Peptidase S8 n=1 Tax=Sporanaerobium hydrogeniformans TaxID=3072179 RepID=A0AC61DLA3_9FIRM|nr:S8 family serine peptidase [Sporanaerobium hydrogeniformans]PHV72317.1 peptidase S8 [Sporanaerobium hydrogeniformans]